MYAGLKIEDEAALLEAKSFREKWLCSIRADLDPVNIDLALAQIAEMKAAQKPASPPTWNDRINHMTVEEKARYIRRYIDCAGCPINKLGGYRCDDYCTDAECVKKLTELLNSPYTEASDD